jgi:hypothetical protein
MPKSRSAPVPPPPVKPKRPIEWVGIAGVIVALLVGLLAWYEMHTGGKDTKDIADAAKSQAQSAKTLADLALQQSKATQKQLDWFNLVDKPSIKLFDLVFGYFLTNGATGGPLFFGASMTNVGRSPAKDLHVDLQYGYAKSLSDNIASIGSDVFDESLVAQEGTISFGGRTKRIPWPDANQLQAINDKQLYLVALLSYTFSDERGPRSPQYKDCYVFSPGSGNNISECPKGAFGQK